MDIARTVLLNVDDYGPGRYARTQVLQQAGFDVREATRGEEALQIAAVHKPAVVLLDVNLPDMSGFEVCRRIKTDPATSAIPVVHLSATFVGPGHRALGLEGGADAYLTEPVEPPVLVATINALLRMRRAEETMRALARQWQATFDAIADGVALLNGAGTVLQCNRSFPAVLELASDDIIGRSIFELWRGTPVEREDMPFMRMVRSGHREQAEITFGSRWLQATADPVAEDSGRLIGAVYVVSDVTERKRADEDRIVLLSREQAARAQAEAASRAKDEFLATVSHELRAPLNVMLGWGRMLRSGVLDDAATRHALDTIERNIRLQAQLIDDLLDVSRITSGKLRLDVRPVDIPAVVQAALDSVEVAAEAKSIRIETVLAPDLTPILADPGRLQQIIWNLMSNAIKFTPMHGRVTVAVEQSDSAVRITVSDSGQGISRDFLPFVFDRFRQADSTSTRLHGGLGLGLAIVRHLVELHGGSVKVDSPGEGKGATFTVTLPLRVSVQDRRLPEPRPDPEPPASLPGLEGLRVVVVDDEDDTRVLMRALLERCGAAVTAVGSAREALAVLEVVQPDVLVSDIAMPGDDGYALIRRLRSRPRDRGGEVPAIALTAYARREDEMRAVEAGYQMHVVKPVDPGALAHAIARLARRGDAQSPQ